MLFNILRGGYSGIQILAGVFASVFVVFCTLPIHEYAHAWVATKLGPLDGSRILQLLIPQKYYFKFMQYERYIILIVFALLFFNVLTKPLGWLQSFVYNALDFIVSYPFRLGR